MPQQDARSQLADDTSLACAERRSYRELRERPIDRARRRLATFAHAMSRRKPTAASRTSRNGCTLPTMSRFIETTAMPMLAATDRGRREIARDDAHVGVGLSDRQARFEPAIACVLTSPPRSRNDGCSTGRWSDVALFTIEREPTG